MPGMRVAAMRGNSMEDSKAKLQRAENSMLFAKKMVAAIENTELRTRMKALTSNQALTSTFIFGTAASCMFNTDSLTPDLGDSEYDAKMVVKSLFFCLSAFPREDAFEDTFELLSPPACGSADGKCQQPGSGL